MPSSPSRRRSWLLFGFGVAAPLVLWPVWSVAQSRPPTGRTSQTMIAPEEGFAPDTHVNRRLAKAAKALDLEGVRAAFTAGASADLQIGWSGTTETMPVAIAAAYAEVGQEARARPVFREIVSRVKEPNAAQGRLGNTLLMHCVEVDCPSLVPALLARKPRLESADREGWTALAHAAAEGKLELVRTFVAHGANVNAADAQGRTVLMLAIDAGANDEYRSSRAEMDESTLR